MGSRLTMPATLLFFIIVVFSPVVFPAPFPREGIHLPQIYNIELPIAGQNDVFEEQIIGNNLFDAERVREAKEKAEDKKKDPKKEAPKKEDPKKEDAKEEDPKKESYRRGRSKRGRYKRGRSKKERCKRGRCKRGRSKKERFKSRRGRREDNGIRVKEARSRG